jgi:outer membrane protein TolC
MIKSIFKNMRIAVLLLVLITYSKLNAQIVEDDTATLTLKNVVSLAIRKSSSAKYAQNRNVNYYWRWKNFRTKFRPQLELESDFPIYTNATKGVTQPDGTKRFVPVSNLENTARIALNQRIPQLGTYIYASTSVDRFEDLNSGSVQYSGSPFQIGIYQPIFAFNWSKWQKKTEPLVYEEAQRNYLETIEEISRNATYRFFRYLRYQTNYQLAQSNLKNSEDNLRIAEMKQKLGRISENDFARIKLSVYNAQKDLNQAQMQLKNADFELKSYIGLEQSEDIELVIPLNMILFEIDSDKALEEALANRKEPLRSKRRLIQAERELVQAKRNNGPQIVVRGNYGISKSAPTFGDVYQETLPQRELQLTFEIPILDWGRSASEVKLAESNQQLVRYDVEQDMKDFRREVTVQVEQFSLLEDQLTTVKEADEVAENGYEIALKKFQNGEISITDLNIALAEREKAKRDYINSLEDYWVAYYNLRILTLYDFELDRKITYDNPLLESVNQ